MAVNKNFVVKNGLEVNENLLVADVDTQKVGIGTSVSSYELHVLGGIGATDAHFTGISSFNSDVRIGLGGTVFTALRGGAGKVGIGTTNPIFALDVQSSASTGTTAVYIKGDAHITGALTIDSDVTYDEVEGRNLSISGVGTVTRFNATDIVGTSATITTIKGTTGTIPTITASTKATVGVLSATDAVVSGAATFNNDLSVLGNLNVTGDLSYDEVTGRNINITGVSSLAGIATFNPNGSQITGLSTFDGNVHLLDNKTLYFGGTPGTTTGDLQLFHDASHSYIRDQGTGDIRVRASGFDVRDSANALSILRADASGFMATTGIATVGVASITDVVVAGASTFTGQVTFNYGSITFANVNATNQNVTGIGTVGILSATDAVVSGAATFNNDLSVLGDLNVTGDISYDEQTARNLNVTGIATIATLVGYSSEFSGAIGFSSQTSATASSTLVGAAVTTINFIGGGATAHTSADGTVQNLTLPPAGASIGLAIALGG